MLWGCLPVYKDTYYFAMHLWSNLSNIYPLLWVSKALYKYFCSVECKNTVETASGSEKQDPDARFQIPYLSGYKFQKDCYYFSWLLLSSTRVLVTISPSLPGTQHVFDIL